MNDNLLAIHNNQPMAESSKVEIVLQEGNEDFPVDARQLWEGLQSKQDFSTWLKAKVLNNRFFIIEHDFILLHKSVEQNKAGRGGHNRIDYALTIDAAKRVAMAEQTERGEQVRRYFIECEKNLLQKSTFTIPQTYGEALVEAGRLALEVEGQKKVIEEQEQKIEADKPKIEGYNALMNTKTLVSISDMCREVGILNPVKSFFPLLREKGFLTGKNLPTTYSLEHKWIVCKERKVGGKVRPQAMIPRSQFDWWRKWAGRHGLLADSTALTKVGA